MEDIDNDLTQLVFDYLTSNGYKIEDWSNDAIFVRYQMSLIGIFFSENDPNFIQVALHGIADVNEDNITEICQVCNKINQTRKVVKAFVYEDSLSLNYEFYYNNEENIFKQLASSFDIIKVAKGYYHRITMGLK